MIGLQEGSIVQILDDSTNSVNPSERKVEVAVKRSHEFHSSAPSGMGGPVVCEGFQYFDLRGVSKSM
jgi:hypothetical protein